MLTYAALLCTIFALGIAPLIHSQFGVGTPARSAYRPTIQGSNPNDMQYCDHRGSGRRDVGQCG